MISAEYKGHPLSNAASAIAFYYPKVSNGGDLLKDLRKDGDEASVSTLLRVYAAFRMAGDPDARRMKPEDLVNEVDILDRESLAEFNKVMTELLTEKSRLKK